jgi:hypothetical protein
MIKKWRSGNIDILTRAPRSFGPPARGPLAPVILAAAAVVAIGAAVWSYFYGDDEPKPKRRKKKKGKS